MGTVTETPPPGPAPHSPWHDGEVTLQRRAGVAERMEQIGRQVLRTYLNEQHRQFYPQLPFVALGAVDVQGEVWATLRAGHPGFLRAPDPSALHVDLPRDFADPAEAGMDDGQPLGLLGIELHTRRRNRLNGSIRRSDGTGFDLVVGQSYGNCPRYIQLRDFSFARDPGVATARAPLELPGLDARARAMVAGADTFFIASYASGADGQRQVDVSHRGGKPGFVRIEADGALTIPDFNGNMFFNTLGNILATGRAGLVFVDFVSGDLLQLSGGAALLPDSPERAAFEGAERLWRFTPRRAIYRADALPLRWSFRDGGWSPFVLATGAWPAQELPPRR